MGVKKMLNIASVIMCQQPCTIYSALCQAVCVHLRGGSGKGNGNPLQYSCLKNSMDIRAWQATVHGIAKNWTQLSDPVDFILFV